MNVARNTQSSRFRLLRVHTSQNETEPRLSRPAGSTSVFSSVPSSFRPLASTLQNLIVTPRLEFLTTRRKQTANPIPNRYQSPLLRLRHPHLVSNRKSAINFSSNSRLITTLEISNRKYFPLSIPNFPLPFASTMPRSTNGYTTFPIPRFATRFPGRNSPTARHSSQSFRASF